MGVNCNIQVLLLVIGLTVVMGANGGVCPRLKSKFCLDFEGLGYDKTFFPNVMGHGDQKVAKSAMKPFERLAGTKCSPYIHAFICASFLPACPVWKDVPKKPQKPCRELCEMARKDCDDEASELGLEWPEELNCEDLPQHDPTRRNPVCTNYVPPRPAACRKFKLVGPCKQYKPYWYYDVRENKCMTFTYGGCLGNDNRFETKAECWETCSNVAPTIRNIETPQLVSDGGRLEIECSAEGIPDPTVIWERKEGGNVRTKGTDTMRKLIIKKANQAHAGIYFCIAVNEAGKANYTVEVQFEAPVEIVDEIRPQVIMENETAFFVCTATGNPVPEFTWKKLDGPFPDESRVVYEGPVVNTTLGYPIYTSILGIEPAVVSDSGEYQCNASNSAGSYTTVGDLVVQGPPIILQRPEPEQSVSVGDFANFTCMVLASPPYDIIWTKEGDAEWPGDDIRVVMEMDNTVLRINDVVPEDSGVYTCTVDNELGTDSAESYLQVEGFLPTTSIEEGETRLETGGTTGLDSTMATDLEFVTEEPMDVTDGFLETLGTDEMMDTMGAFEPTEGTGSPVPAFMDMTTTPPSVAPAGEEVSLLPRRTDITNPGVRNKFSGWVDVQGQGAANDFCRIVEMYVGYQLACSLAGTEGEKEFNYVSGLMFDVGEPDTFYMKDENGDGKFDYCRCANVEGKRFVWCTAAGENGFYGNEEDEPGTDQYSFKVEGDKSELKKCRRRFVDPFFGIPYRS